MQSAAFTQSLSRFWWLLLLRGVLAILFGIAAFAWPGLTFFTLVMLFAAYAFVDGIFDVVHAVSHRKEIDYWWLLLVEGLFGIVFGVLAFRLPVLTAEIGGVIAAMYIAAWAIVTGAMRIAQAIRLRNEIEGEWLLGACGVLSILFGLWVMARPGAGILAMLYLVACWSILLGVMLIVFAVKARRLGGEVRATAEKLAAP